MATQLDAALVDMETAAVAQVAERFGLPWAAIKATTDEANGESAGDFSANLARAARRAASPSKPVASESSRALMLRPPLRARPDP